jgi:hypothetical protein
MVWIAAGPKKTDIAATTSKSMWSAINGQILFTRYRTAA